MGQGQSDAGTARDRNYKGADISECIPYICIDTSQEGFEIYILCIYIYTCIYLYVYMHIYMCMYMNVIYIYIYIKLYT